jgi:hypothetical protein
LQDNKAKSALENVLLNKLCGNLFEIVGRRRQEQRFALKENGKAQQILFK